MPAKKSSYNDDNQDETPKGKGIRKQRKREKARSRALRQAQKLKEQALREANE